jgi:hypothetical protein
MRIEDSACRWAEGSEKSEFFSSGNRLSGFNCQCSVLYGAKPWHDIPVLYPIMGPLQPKSPFSQ